MNLIVMFNFFCLRPEILFLGKFDPKIQICLFRVKFSRYSYSNMRNFMVIYFFSVLNRKYPLSWFQIMKDLVSVCLTCLTLLCPLFVLTNYLKLKSSLLMTNTK